MYYNDNNRCCLPSRCLCVVDGCQDLLFSYRVKHWQGNVDVKSPHSVVHGQDICRGRCVRSRRGLPRGHEGEAGSALGAR